VRTAEVERDETENSTACPGARTITGASEPSWHTFGKKAYR
jgi:hypothetical protein